ncbi:MAG: hypothetical protein DME23_08960 [Verrucomicrobia bacterium]|nr:MAG: hypothetical protein DME23_08960 [Verrucomicrobiota bacterium]
MWRIPARLLLEILKILACLYGGVVAATFLLCLGAALFFGNYLQGSVSVMKTGQPIAVIVGCLFGGFVVFRSERKARRGASTLSDRKRKEAL